MVLVAEERHGPRRGADLSTCSYGSSKRPGLVSTASPLNGPRRGPGPAPPLCGMCVRGNHGGVSLLASAFFKRVGVGVVSSFIVC